MTFSRFLLQILLLCRSVFSQSVCVWGIQGLQSVTNGIYTYEGQRNNKPYYKKLGDTCSDTLYVYFSLSNSWHIATALYENAGRAYCPSTSASQDPTSCNIWYLYNSSHFMLDPNVFISADSCPSWNCDQISIPNLSNECRNTFDVYVGNNIWTNTLNNLYWYFHPIHFQWECSISYPDDICMTQSILANTTQGWIDIPKGETRVLYFDYPDDNHRSLHCIDVSHTVPLAPSSVQLTTTARETSSTTVNTSSLPFITSNSPSLQLTATTQTNGVAIGSTIWVHINYIVICVVGTVLCCICAASIVYRFRQKPKRNSYSNDASEIELKQIKSAAEDSSDSDTMNACNGVQNVIDVDTAGNEMEGIVESKNDKYDAFDEFDDPNIEDLYNKGTLSTKYTSPMDGINKQNSFDIVTQEGVNDDRGYDGIRGKCVDCGGIKEGRVYDEDGMFYCNECWVQYEM